jgi:hypothetical protein
MSSWIRSALARTWIVAVVLAGAGCTGSGPGTDVGSATPTSMGMLPAEWTSPDGTREPVPFSYEGEGKATGILFTTLGKGGEHFRGRYALVEASPRSHVITEVFDGWSSAEWTAWERKPDGQWTAEAGGFAQLGHLYTDRIVAYLPGSDGHSMRCRFTLNRPESGFVEGGHGECQTTDGSEIELEFGDRADLSEP